MSVPSGPIRIQRKRTKGYKLPINTVSVTRGTQFGNPFIIGVHVANNHEAVEYFEAWALGLCMPRKPGAPIIPALDGFESLLFKEVVKTKLRGKNLACFCRLSEPCHADILLKLANED